VATILVIVADICPHEPDEMPLAEDNDVLEKLAPAISYPALGGSVLPGAAIGDANRLCAHGPYELDHRRAEYRIAVEDQVSRRGVVQKRLTQLAASPTPTWH